MCELSPVSFHGDTIYCIDYQNQPFTPMRPIVENLGLDWGSQSAKLNSNKQRWTVAMIATVAQDGNEREMLCLPVRKLPAYLASINPNKVREELRPKIELYQAESDDALWNYWMNGKAERKPQTPSLPDWFRPLDEDDTAGYLVSKKFRPIFLTFSKNCGVVSLTEPEKLLETDALTSVKAFLLPYFAYNARLYWSGVGKQ